MSEGALRSALFQPSNRVALPLGLQICCIRLDKIAKSITTMIYLEVIKCHRGLAP